MIFHRTAKNRSRTVKTNRRKTKIRSFLRNLQFKMKSVTSLKIYFRIFQLQNKGLPYVLAKEYSHLADFLSSQKNKLFFCEKYSFTNLIKHWTFIKELISNLSKMFLWRKKNSFTKKYSLTEGVKYSLPKNSFARTYGTHINFIKN